jgi:hypothetical protein
MFPNRTGSNFRTSKVHQNLHPAACLFRCGIDALNHSGPGILVVMCTIDTDSLNAQLSKAQHEAVAVSGLAGRCYKEMNRPTLRAGPQ